MAKKGKNIKENLIEKTEEIVENITEKPKQKIEHIKQDAREYYKGKNMISRYIIIGFLLILFILQFLLPSLDNDKTKDKDFSTNMSGIFKSTSEYTNKSGTIMFLGHWVDTNNIVYDETLANMVSNTLEIEFIYKKSVLLLPDIVEILRHEDMPIDFQYLALLHGVDSQLRDLPLDIAQDYGLRVDNDIDETLDVSKSTQVSIEYLADLYDEFGERDLALIGYLIGEDKLDDIIGTQGKTSFDDLYLDKEIMSKYYKIIIYKSILQNISRYIDIKDVVIYPHNNTVKISVGKIADLIERSEKEGYTFKEIKELNPWILGNSIPRGTWNLKVYSE